MDGQYGDSTSSGYPPAGVDRNNLDAKYLCSFCGDLLREAVRTECGHFYCESCLEQCFIGNDSTPLCCVKDGKVIHKNQVFKDEFMRREILALVVSCTFHDEGCAWRGKVQHFENHEVTCEFMKVRCVHEACGLLIIRRDLGHHLATECSYRPAKCLFCDAEISFNSMKEHLRTYHKHLHYEMDNLRDVVDDILRILDDLQEGQRDHQEGQRDLQERQRNFQEMQRDLRDLQEGKRDLQDGQRDLQEGQRVFQRHLEEQQNRIDHLESAVRELQETFSEVIRSHDDQKMEQDLFNDILANLQDTPDKALHESVRRQERRVESLELTPAFGSVTLADLERRCMGHMKRQLDTNQESVRRQERRIEFIEHTLALTLADLEQYLRQEEFSSYDGELLWKISDYARRRNDAVTEQQLSFYSPYLFTSRYGYKLCARLYLNGDGMGRGTHISLFIVVMRGEYDALLRWPFRQKVTFMLLDQDNVEHVIDSFRPDPRSSSFQRPRSENNIASGCPMFCSLVELNNHAYVRDDTMFVKITVDTSDL